VAATVTLPKSIAERARREAEKLGVSLEEFIVELLIQGLDPRDRAAGYVEASEELLGQAKEELRKGDTRQAAEKAWGAAALAVKAYAMCREGKRLTSHGELWRYRRRLAKEVGKWVKISWAYANMMHTCFYENWCDREDVGDALEYIERLVSEVRSRVERT